MKSCFPNKGFWEVTIEYTEEDEKGKKKKTKEVHLVDAANLVEIEHLIKEFNDGDLRDYKVKNVKKSPITILVQE